MISIAKNQLLLILVIFSLFGYAQEDKSQEQRNQQDSENLFRKLEFYDLRGTNAIDTGAGISLINNDYPEPEVEFYFRIGYKYHVTEHFDINLTFNRYNLAFNDTFNESFMSFDLNLEYLINPFKRFSPFLYGGYGYNADSDFESTQTKVQAGLGIEFIVIEGVGIKLFGEYNYALSNELEGLIVPNNDESFLRAGVGLNFYFGGNKRKERLLNSMDTVINSNLIK